MSLEAAIRSELLAHAGIATLIEERIFLGRMPTEFRLPAITTIVTFERALQVNQGLTDVREALYRIDIWDEDYSTIRRLLEACRAALIGRVINRHGVRVGLITEDSGTILEPTSPDEIWHGVLELSTPYRYEG